MQGHHVAILRCKGMADAIPDIAALSRFRRRQICVGKLIVYGPQARSVIPQNVVSLRQAGKIFPGKFKLFPVGAIQTDDNVIDVICAAKFIDNSGQRRRFQLRKQRWQNQCYFSLLGKLHELALQILGRLVR